MAPVSSRSRAALSVLFLVFAGRAKAADEIRPALVDGVREFAATGLPGSVAVYGPGAEAIVVGTAGGGAKVAVVAGARAGRGRVVAFGHDGYFRPDVLGKADTGRLLVNAVRWAGTGNRGKTTTKAPAATRVGVVREAGLLEYLRKSGVAAL
ncbi:hypothetical protein OJF2_48080 [Aquisphaera giovannonii]|uniref:Uncharacterized protein n=1 Tax=Aquisphaera giovannonii TaxID=406548 RepID=A0A5B9W6S1_9BACT|nr:hypothetical protein [Aquisphaera giovannonii]QEH36248.1 hypothetical protein OJF2_48080 [Aquisphaera giovannonii]